MRYKFSLHQMDALNLLKELIIKDKLNVQCTYGKNDSATVVCCWNRYRNPNKL
jgi:hypothetical protein